MRKLLISASDRLAKISKIIVTVILMISFVLILYQVFSRYVLQQPFMSRLFSGVDFVQFSFAWLEEIVRFMFVWCVFLSVSLVTLNMGHARIEFIAERFPKKVQRVLFYITESVNFLFFVFLCWQSVVLISIMHGQRSPLLMIDMRLLYLSIVVGSVFCAIHLARLFFDGLERSKLTEAAEQEGGDA